MDQTMETFVMHPFHDHGLILRELSGRATGVTCFICGEEDVKGSTYCCEECDIFIHSECVTLPLQLIQHPFHSYHPIKLVLQEDTRSPVECKICTFQINTDACYRYKYECDVCTCPVSFCVRCVSLSLTLHLKEEKKEKVEVPEYLPQHNHPLTLFDVTMLNRIKCKVCIEAIRGPVYMCLICLFSMHESCAQLPNKMIQHPFHPHHPLTLLYSQEVNERRRCKACYLCTYANYIFHCESSECNYYGFYLCTTCAALSLLPRPDWKWETLISPDWKWETLISSSIHPHPLLSFPIGKMRISNFDCSVCRQIFAYYDEFYCCLDCLVFFHKKCAEMPQQLIHPIHPKHPLTLQRITSNSFDCGHCSLRQWDRGYFLFNCKCCEFYLCIHCALRFLADGDKVMSLDFQHLVHEHPLTFRPSQGDTAAGDEFCTVCNIREAGDEAGKMYGCNSFDGFSIHETCLKEVLEINHPFHPSHPLKRITSDCGEHGNDRCSGCFTKWTFFHCAECSFNLCKICAFNKMPTISHQPHMHELTYFTSIDPSMKLLCNYCGITCSADLYRCVDCNFNLHHDCASLPLTAIDEYHHHELSLCAKALGDYADKNEFNCSHCQCSRDPKLGLYACEPCHYYAHIHCMLPEEKVKRKKVAETVCQKWEKKISTQKEKVEKLHTQLNEAQEELESMMIEKEQEIEDLAIRDDIDEL